VTGDSVSQVAEPEKADVRVKHRRDRHELIIELGPVDLPGGQRHGGDIELLKRPTLLPVDGWVHGYVLELTDRYGNRVPRSVLHHIEVTRPSHRDLFLNEPQRLMVMGAETKDRKFPGWMVGIPMKAGDPVVVSMRLRNDAPVAYDGVTVRVVLPYVTRRPDVEVHGFRVDVMFPTGFVEFDLPPGRSVWTWEGSPGFDGRVFAVTGHVHRFAESLVLEDLTANRVLYRAEPSASDIKGEVVEMPVKVLSWGRGYVVRPEHRYRITASYFNPTEQPIPGGGMANVGGVYAPVDRLPPLEPRLPLGLQEASIGNACEASPNLGARGRTP
jgi:hypothetical protein